jgi:hypothetical protein
MSNTPRMTEMLNEFARSIAGIFFRYRDNSDAAIQDYRARLRCEAIIAHAMRERGCLLVRNLFILQFIVGLNNQINALQSRADTSREEEILI